jgi:ACS family glucarate transporter-like MFS transporter
MFFENKKMIIFLMCLGNVAVSFNTGAVAAAIPIMSEDLHLNEIAVSRIVSFYMIPYGLGALLYAPLTRYISYRVVLMTAMILFGIFSLLTAQASDLTHMLVAQIGAGVMAASSTPLSLMVIGDLFEKDLRGRLVGLYFGVSFVASIIGMLFMGFVSWRLLFIIPAILAGLTALFLFILKGSELDFRHKAHINYLRIMAHVPIIKVFVFIFMMSFLYHGLIKWYGVYLSKDYFLGKSSISLFLILAACCGMIGQNFGGYMTDKKGRIFSSFIGGLILASGAAALLLHYPIFLVPFILGIISLGWTMNHNAVSTILTDMDDKHRPLVASLNSSVRFFSGGLGFLATGLFVKSGFSLLFFVIGILFLLLTVSQRYFLFSN